MPAHIDEGTLRKLAQRLSTTHGTNENALLSEGVFVGFATREGITFPVIWATIAQAQILVGKNGEAIQGSIQEKPLQEQEIRDVCRYCLLDGQVLGISIEPIKV